MLIHNNNANSCSFASPVRYFHIKSFKIQSIAFACWELEDLFIVVTYDCYTLYIIQMEATQTVWQEMWFNCDFFSFPKTVAASSQDINFKYFPLKLSHRKRNWAWHFMENVRLTIHVMQFSMNVKQYFIAKYQVIILITNAAGLMVPSFKYHKRSKHLTIKWAYFNGTVLSKPSNIIFIYSR